MRNAIHLLILAAGAMTAAEPEVRVVLNFSKYGVQLEGPDGGSVCQFHGSDPVRGTVEAGRSYATLAGFPDDGPGTEFGRFCDIAFSTRGTRGMGLSQVWSTPNGLQSPAGSLGKNYSAESWAKLDFSMYEAAPLSPAKFLGKEGSEVRGHTVPMLLAALKRARRENQRILFWNDLHTDYPFWMWQDGQRKNPVPERHWEEAALHVVYYAKWLAARHGVPVHTVSLQNEPDLPSRHQFTPEMLIRMSGILRRKLDEAGLTGVRVMPYTSVMLSTSVIPWRKLTVRTLEQTQELLEGSLKEYQPHIDSLGGHMSHGEGPFALRLPRTRFWRASGDFDNHYKDHTSVTFDMGAPDQTDEVIRLNTWLYGKGVSLAGIWQIALRMGHTVDNFVLPEKVDVARDYKAAAVSGAATVYPFVRPGMFLAAGSQGHEARSEYSVDGFGGRGHREVIVITNSGRPRTFEVQVEGAARADSFTVYQAVLDGERQTLPPAAANAGRLTVTAPADSVTSLVAARASTRPTVVFVTADAGALTAEDRRLVSNLEREYEVRVVNGVLSDAEKRRFDTKRQPLDPMGTAAYVISETVQQREVWQAFRTAMAPVIAMGAASQKALGVRDGQSIRGGEPLAERDELDPPAGLLEKGLPKACGDRAGWSHARPAAQLLKTLRAFVARPE